MKVNIQTNCCGVPLAQLKPGDVFLHRGRVYMLTTKKEYALRLSVDLETGMMASISASTDDVWPLHGEYRETSESRYSICVEQTSAMPDPIGSRSIPHFIIAHGKPTLRFEAEFTDKAQAQWAAEHIDRVMREARNR